MDAWVESGVTVALLAEAFRPASANLSRMTAKDFTETRHTENVNISEKACHEYDVMYRAKYYTFRGFVFQ